MGGRVDYDRIASSFDERYRANDYGGVERALLSFIGAAGRPSKSAAARDIGSRGSRAKASWSLYRAGIDGIVSEAQALAASRETMVLPVDLRLWATTATIAP